MPRANFRSAAEKSIYRIWVNMRDRCRRQKHPMFSRYGGRGITVCERWSVFENFVDDMGPRPTGGTLERKNNDGPYAPWNCEWASVEKQNRNRSGLSHVIVYGESLPMMTAWRKYCRVGITYEAFVNRITEQRMQPEAALTKPRESWTKARAA